MKKNRRYDEDSPQKVNPGLTDILPNSITSSPLEISSQIDFCGSRLPVLIQVSQADGFVDNVSAKVIFNIGGRDPINIIAVKTIKNVSLHEARLRFHSKKQRKSTSIPGLLLPPGCFHPLAFLNKILKLNS